MPDSNFSQLGFTEDQVVQATSRINEKGETVIYWTDGVNPPKYYNIDTNDGFSDPKELNIFPFIDSPIQIELDKVLDFGGSLISGSYQFAARYVDADGNTTDFMAISKPIDIVRMTQKDASGGYFVQGNPTNLTGKSIKLSLSGLDGFYDYIQLAIIRYEDGGVGEVSLTESFSNPANDTITSIEYTFTGSEGVIDGSIEEVLINNAYYDSAKCLTQVDNTLYLANLTKKPEIRFQKFCNSVKLEAVSKTLDGTGEKYAWSFGDETLTYFNKSFRREEVYAFYLSFTLDNGQETKAFHIPGRASEGTEENSDSFGTDLGETVKQFHVRSPAGTNNMSFWENGTETYPDTEDWDIITLDASGNETVAGSLRNQPVRHHKFPSYADEPLTGTASTNGKDATVNVLGVKIKDLVIPDDIRARVKRVNLYYARKDINNRLVLDQGWSCQVETDGTNSAYRNKLQSNSSENPVGETSFSTVPFSIMLRDTSIAGVSYLKSNATAKVTAMDDYDGGTGLKEAIHLMEQGNTSTGSSDYLHTINAIARIPAHKDLVNITNLGFSQNAETLNQNSGILIEMGEAFSGIAWSTLNVGDSSGRMMSLMQLKKELFAPFDLQELVLVGSIDSGIENYAPDATAGEKTAGEVSLYGGDTFINKFGFKIGGYDAADAEAKHAMFVIVESYDNIAFRQAGENYGEVNWNNESQVGTYLDLEDDDPESDPDDFYDNYFEYDLSHSVDGHLAVKTTPFPKIFREITEFPDRVIRGQVDTDSEFIDRFRVFLESDYLDFPRNRGEIINLDVMQNILLVHMKRGLFRTKGREEIVTNDFRAFLGNGDIFAVKPDEMFSIEEGYAGLQGQRAAVSTPAGYFFVDQQAKKVFLLGDKPSEISDLGMRNFFEDRLEWDINELSSTASEDLIKPEIVTSYDPKYKRIILTKRDWKPTAALLAANWTIADGVVKVDGTEVAYTNATYFTDTSFTISFLPEINRWASFHSYIPDYIYNDINNLYSAKGGDIYNHEGNPAEYYGTQEDMIYEFVDNRDPKLTKLVQNVEFITYAYDAGEENRVNHKKTFDAIRVSNELQDTGSVDLIYFTDANGNVRNSGHTWKVNKFRDLIDPATGNLDPSLTFDKQKKLTGKYAIVRLYYTPEDARFLRLIDADVNFRRFPR